jgi:hypothetical protein
MATIIPATEYLDGSVLDPASHNTNVYSTGTQGVVSTMNGGLDSANLDPTFTDATSDLILPGQVAQPSIEAATDLVQCFGDLFGDEATEHEDVIAAPEKLKPIPGLGKRIYLSYAASCVMWEWSYFVNSQRIHMKVPLLDVNDDGVYASFGNFSGLVLIGVKLNGVLIQESIRPLPRSLLKSQTNGTNNAGTAIYSYVSRNSFSVDMHYLQQDPAAGWHSLEVCLYCENMQLGNSTDTSGNSIMDAQDVMVYAHRSGSSGTHAADINNAAVFGVRNVRATPLY